MQNTKIADATVVMMRHFITGNSAETLKTVSIPVENALEILSCLERLSILERHLSNLVSTAYEHINENS